jgi:hypothetical protein
MTAGTAEDIRVTYIKLSACSKDAAYGGNQSNLSKIALYEGSTRLTTEKGWDSSTATTVTFSASDFLNSQGIGITKGSQKNITVKADVPSTGTADESIALGISTTTDSFLTTHVVFVGMESNTTPTTTLSYSTAIGGVNFTTTSAQDASINYITLKAAGTLTIQSSADTPESNIVSVGVNGVGREDVVFLKVDFTAAREDIDIKALTIDRVGNRDGDFSDISLWDGVTQLGVDQSLVNSGISNSSTTFSFAAGSYWRVPSGTTKTLTVKADLNGAKSADILSGVTTGDTPQICLASGEANGNYLLSAMGVSSGVDINASSSVALCGNWQLLHQSKPTVAAASLPSTVLQAGEKTLYRWTVTADSKGAIGWSKVIFDMSGSVDIGGTDYTIGIGYGSSTDGIYMGTSSAIEHIAKKLISTSSLKVYNVGTGDEVAASTTLAGVGRGVYVWNYLAGGARILFVPSTEQVIAAGETKTYELRGSIAYGGSAGDSISTQIARRSTATSTGSFVTVAQDGGELFGYNVTSTAATFVWTDRSGAGATHSGSTADWSLDYKVSGIPTATLSLSK